MSHEEIRNVLSKFQEIEHRINKLESMQLDLDSLKEELEKLKVDIGDLRVDFAPMIVHMQKWDKRDHMLYKTILRINKYIYAPIHLGLKSTILIGTKILIFLATGIIAGILLNGIGSSTAMAAILDFLSKLFK